MQQELTPKQQAVELIKQANHILLVAGKQPNNDQLGAMVALELILKRAGKQVSAIMTGELPKLAKAVDTKSISRDLTGIRDFVVRLDTKDTLENEVIDDDIVKNEEVENEGKQSSKKLQNPQTDEWYPEPSKADTPPQASSQSKKK